MAHQREKENHEKHSAFLNKFRGRTSVLGKDGALNSTNATSLPSLQLPNRTPNPTRSKKSTQLLNKQQTYKSQHHPALPDKNNQLRLHLQNYSEEAHPRPNFNNYANQLRKLTQRKRQEVQGKETGGFLESTISNLDKEGQKAYLLLDGLQERLFLAQKQQSK